MMAFATRYEVNTHVTSSTVAERFPAMCGRETFTTVVSSTSMKVQNITEMAIIQGLMCFGSGIGGGTRREHFHDSKLAKVRLPGELAGARTARAPVIFRGHPRLIVGFLCGYCTRIFPALE